ncbi:type III pantothenate kinase, partial [bacterium]|nr:type III pantothenate kinase [bacterium]
MIIAVDIGNTNITVGIVKNHRVQHYWRLATQLWRTEDEHHILFKELLKDAGVSASEIEGTALSCVVPPLRRPVMDALSNLVNCDCFVVEPGVRIGMKVNYHLPSHVGADRIVNAFAAKKYYGFPVIIIDFGAGTTFCVVDSHGDYCGGAIFPVVRSSATALYNAASLLPRVAFQAPQEVV